MQRRDEPTEVRRLRLDLAIQELAADLVDERRRRHALEREVEALRSELARLEAAQPNPLRKPER